ncbi:thioredoxin family protein [Bacteroides sp. OttesenSCG-928-F21]|nr:thioredoxin family protein [Bacteroides sp. OttesenSCG-928-F21]
MRNFENIRIKVSHIVSLIFLFVVFTTILGAQSLKRSSVETTENLLTELSEGSFSDSIASGMCFVLFYVADSEPCNVMTHHLSILAQAKQKKVGFYRVNLDKYPQYSITHNIAGIPNLLIFENGVETKRIMGVVSERNLHRIFDKTINLTKKTP